MMATFLLTLPVAAVSGSRWNGSFSALRASVACDATAS